ncbi:hypothetical protein [Ancylobacter sp.]|uniref:hypothetical protein n=1 Tax=Ancylobacter sp. TaxID=1872567 RepID=UPI003D103623
MSELPVPPAECETPAPAVPVAPTDERRRAALGRLGRTAAYAVPATVSLMMMTRAAHAS